MRQRIDIAPFLQSKPHFVSLKAEHACSYRSINVIPVALVLFPHQQTYLGFH